MKARAFPATAIGVLTLLGAAHGAEPARFLGELARRDVPSPDYGTLEYSTTNVSAMAFFPEQSNHGYSTSPTFGRYGDLGYSDHYYASLDLPAGVIVDYIGLNNLNDGTDAVMTATLWDRHADGTKHALASASSTPHTSWSTDSAGPFNALFDSHANRVLVLEVQVLAAGDFEFFGFVEVKWRRVVSGGPPLATFPDVPKSHPFFKFVEALHSAGITSGYPDGRFGVDDSITRGQMAVFLATALGLHWPD